MKNLNDFALKEEFKLLQPIGDKLAEIDSLIDRKFFFTIFESIYFYRTVFGGRPGGWSHYYVKSTCFAAIVGFIGLWT